MYISFFNADRERDVLANLENVDKVEVRPRDGVRASETDVWEIAVFYRDERRFNPARGSTGDPEWVGRYDVAARGSKEDCQHILNNIIVSIQNNQRVYTL